MRPVLFQIGNVKLYSYGLMLYLAGLSAILVAARRAKRKKLDPAFVPNLGIYSIIAGLIGAKVLYLLTVIPDLAEDFFGTLKVSLSSGFVVYGGVIAGLGFAYYYCRRHGKYPLAYLDLATPSIALGQAFGRVGCTLAGCCYGRETDAWYGITFPHGSGAPAGVSLFPSQPVSVALNLLNFIILCIFDSKNDKCGRTFALYMINYSIGRFIIEFFRNDYRGSIGPLSTSQFISVFVFIAGIALMIYFTKKGIKAPEEVQTGEGKTAEQTA